MNWRTKFINRIIKSKGYKSYLEIGINDGINYTRVECPSKMGIDIKEITNVVNILKISSDDFFEISKFKFDLIFVDGLHHEEQFTRDVINSLKSLNPGGTILCHDINPQQELHQRVPRETVHWTGDVWKGWVKIRAWEDTHSFCVKEETGIGVIQKKPNQNKCCIHAPDNPDWEFLDTYRKDIMNFEIPEEWMKIVYP